MEVFVVTVLDESINLNTCSARVFSTYEKAKEYADKAIKDAADEYGGEIRESFNFRMTMCAGDEYVTVEILKTEVE